MNRKIICLFRVGLLILAVMIMSGCAEDVQHTPAAYTLSVSVSPSGAGSVSPLGNQYEEGTQVTLTATPASGYTFDHWSGDATGKSSPVTIVMDSEKSITAHFVAQYTLNASVSPSSGGTVSPAGGTYDAGTEVTLNASPASGYAFDHWSGDATGKSSPVTIVMDSEKSITAHFVAQYTLNASVSPSSGGAVSPDSGTYDDGAELELTATPTSGYVFDYWSGDAAGASNPVTIIMDSDKSITAHFKAHVEDGMIFQDNFDDNRNNWGGTVKDGLLYIGEISKEGYTVITEKYKWPPAAPDYPDFGYEVEIIPIEADVSWGKGLVFLCREKLRYAFIISGNGNYKLIERGEEDRTIIDWTVSSHIKQGNVSNILKVICRDSIIELYANGHLLESVSGEFPDDIGGNGIGLMVTASGGSTLIAFDNMKMWVVNPND